MTELSMYKLFGLKRVLQMDDLDEWLSDLPKLTKEEKIVAKVYQSRLLENVDVWNEQELSLYFIGPIFASINYTILHRLNLFAQRTIFAQVGSYLLNGKPDGIIASGYIEPETPFFCFQEYKKEQDGSGSPIGQNLAAMLVGQQQNGNDDPIYGCYVVGRNWFFMILKGQEFAISKDFSATDEDLFNIIKILKVLRMKLIARLKIVE